MLKISKINYFNKLFYFIHTSLLASQLHCNFYFIFVNNALQSNMLNLQQSLVELLS